MTLGNTLSLIFLALLIPLAWVWRRSLVDQDSFKKNLSLVFRCLGIITLIIALCRPSFEQETDDLHLIYLVDSSQSIDPKSLERAHEWIQESLGEQGVNDSSEVFLFASSVKKVTIDELGSFVDQAKAGTSDSQFRSASPISNSLGAMRSVFPANKAKKLVVLTDAKNTGEETASAIERLGEEGIEVVFKPLESLDHSEVSVVELTPSSQFSYQGEIVRLTSSLLSNTDQEVEARLLAHA